MIPEKLVKAVVEATREYEEQRKVLEQYIRTTTPHGVKRERRTSKEMESILDTDSMFTIEYGCSFGFKSHWKLRELKKKNRYLDGSSLTHRTIEIHLYDGDLENYLPEIKQSLKALRGQKDLHLCIHEPLPLVYKGKPLDLSTTKKRYLDNTKECLETLSSICDECGLIGFVAHPYGTNPSRESYKSLIHNLKTEIDETIKSKMFLENVEHFSNPEQMIDVYNLGSELCFDVAHGQILLGTEKLVESVVQLSPIVRNWHLSDVRDNEHGYMIGSGTVPWWDIFHFIRGHAILEVRNIDEFDPVEMKLSIGASRIMRGITDSDKMKKIYKKHGYDAVI